MKDRNVGIDILKFLAVILITNSHMQLLYGKYSILATGGAIGDALFFFCSGFTLFLKPMESVRDFPNWYKRRINRIYPTVLAVAIVFCTFFGLRNDINWIILHGGGWFVTYIMVYYVFIYFVGLYFREKVNWVLAFVILCTMISFYAINRPFPFNMYGEGRYPVKGFLFFIFMLLGAKVGMMDSARQAQHQWRNLLLAFAGVVTFYAVIGLCSRIERMESLYVLSIFPLIMITYFTYLWGEGRTAKSIYNNKVGYFIIRFVGGLCLEVYLVQNSLFTDRFNFLFPLNLLIMFAIIVVAAYLLRCFSRLISQTFKDAPYDWKKMVSIY